MALSTNQELPESSIYLAVTGGYGEQPLWEARLILAQAEEETQPQDGTGDDAITTEPGKAIPSPAAETSGWQDAGVWWGIGIAIVLAVIFVVWWQGRRRRRRTAPGATQTGEFMGRSKRGRR